MELQYYGANCVRITTKQTNLVIDDNLADLGLKSITKPDDVSLFTFLPPANRPASRLTFSDPGEYEVGGVGIRGIAARSHLDEPGQMTATMYTIDYDDIDVAVLGHIYPDLTENQLEAIGTVDLLILPVGGNGYTMDGIGALKMIKQIEPKVVILTHYADSDTNYPVPQQALPDALKNMAMEPTATLAKYKVKPADFGETTQLVILERQ
jgi:L-ascorbate metabolism protein UlaG (beta-lactamase superfamily)